MLFLFPSLYEGFGMPILEAMACGTPVLTSNVTSLPEVAGDAAVQVDPYDVESIEKGILRLLETPSLREQYIQKGLERVKEFGWEKTARETLTAYRKTLLA
jgi:glycosyltransferase involved in cell wall biosynthesis